MFINLPHRLEELWKNTLQC